jgi:hypothetical protein
MADSKQPGNATYPSGSPFAVDISVANHSFAEVSRYFYVGGAGDLIITAENGAAITYKAVPVGSIIPVRANGVVRTNTTATYIIAHP